MLLLVPPVDEVEVVSSPLEVAASAVDDDDYNNKTKVVH